MVLKVFGQTCHITQVVTYYEPHYKLFVRDAADYTYVKNLYEAIIVLRQGEKKHEPYLAEFIDVEICSEKNIQWKDIFSAKILPHCPELVNASWKKTKKDYCGNKYIYGFKVYIYQEIVDSNPCAFVPGVLQASIVAETVENLIVNVKNALALYIECLYLLEDHIFHQSYFMLEINTTEPMDKETAIHTLIEAEMLELQNQEESFEVYGMGYDADYLYMEKFLSETAVTGIDWHNLLLGYDFEIVKEREGMAVFINYDSHKRWLDYVIVNIDPIVIPHCVSRFLLSRVEIFDFDARDYFINHRINKWKCAK